MFPSAMNGSQATILTYYCVLTATFTLTLLLPLLNIKYLFKNCHKTEDYASARIQGISDGIELYRKTRYISATEATWRLLGFQMIDRNPAVAKLHAHLEGEQHVLFPSNATQAQRLGLTNRTHSPLME